jgi:hypothetical protein
MYPRNSFLREKFLLIPRFGKAVSSHLRAQLFLVHPHARSHRRDFGTFSLRPRVFAHTISRFVCVSAVARGTVQLLAPRRDRKTSVESDSRERREKADASTPAGSQRSGDSGSCVCMVM